MAQTLKGSLDESCGEAVGRTARTPPICQELPSFLNVDLGWELGQLLSSGLRKWKMKKRCSGRQLMTSFLVHLSAPFAENDVCFLGSALPRSSATTVRQRRALGTCL